jgi:putative membrane protein
MMYDWNGPLWHGAGWEGWLMFMFMIVFVAAVVVAIVFLVRYLAQSHPSPPAPNGSTGESATEILKRRYATGEIDREEYLQKLKDL